MTELLAIPAWDTAPTTLNDWTAALAESGHPPIIAQDEDETWIEIGALRLRGFVALEGGHVEAINFELADPDPAEATRVLVKAARALGWEVHPDEPEEDNLDED